MIDDGYFNIEEVPANEDFEIPSDDEEFDEFEEDKLDIEDEEEEEAEFDEEADEEQKVDEEGNDKILEIQSSERA